MAINSADAVELLCELNQILQQMTGDNGARHFQEADVEQGRSTFLVGYIDGKPYACGALREFSPTCGELKRIYARKNSAGMGQHILKALESEARKYHYQRLVLETRIQNHHAIQFYEKNGFSLCPNYGIYKDCKNACCFQKDV